MGPTSYVFTLHAPPAHHSQPSSRYPVQGRVAAWASPAGERPVDGGDVRTNTCMLCCDMHVCGCWGRRVACGAVCGTGRRLGEAHAQAGFVARAETPRLCAVFRGKMALRLDAGTDTPVVTAWDDARGDG